MDANRIYFGVFVMSLGGVIDVLLSELRVKVSSLDERLLFLEGEKSRLEADEIIYAVEYWRGAKYMYLNYPSSKGEKRRRVYVGANPVNIEKARQGILRSKEYDLVLQEIGEITDIYDKVSLLINDASRHLDKKL